MPEECREQKFLQKYFHPNAIHISKTALSIVEIMFMHVVDIDTNRIKSYNCEMATAILKIESNTYYKSLVLLRKQGAIKEHNGDQYFNPLMFFAGSKSCREKAIEKINGWDCPEERIHVDSSVQTLIDQIGWYKVNAFKNRQPASQTKSTQNL